MRCPICASEVRAPEGPHDVATRLDAKRVGSSRNDAAATALATCRTCGLAWQSEPPKSEEIDLAYQGMRDETYLAEADNRLRTFERGARLLRAHARGLQGRDLLDVGCSAGFFLEVALRDGWQAWGVEPSEWMSARARDRVGDRVFTATLEQAPLDGRRFDVVTMWDVLEHVLDPHAFVKAATGALRPSGLLVVNVPARDSLVARALGPRWPLLLPEHLFYFTRPSLRCLLEQHGFEVLGFHQHVVFFSLGYVLRRLAQHAWPGTGAAARALGRADLLMPLLMGEVTVVARLRG